MKYLVFGAGRFGKALGKYILEKTQDELIAYLDRDESKTELSFENVTVPVYRPSELGEVNFDIVMISVDEVETIHEMKKQLFDLGISEDRIKVFTEDRGLLIAAFSNYNVYIDEYLDRRIWFLEDFKRIVNEKRMKGGVAECGVYRGDFAHFVSKTFPTERFYLFDTFSGFDQRDLKEENTLGNAEFQKSSFNRTEAFANTSIDIVLNKMVNPERCIIKKGFFPETAEGIDETFIFVSLDMDLYQPMLEGLRYFYPRMEKGGVILCHDYYSTTLSGVRQAFSDFEKETPFQMIPVGDAFSMAIVKV